MKEKLIETKANKKIIEITINRRAWKKNIINMMFFIITLLTISAIILAPASLMSMIVNDCITETPLIIFISCLAWLGLVIIYNIWITKE